MSTPRALLSISEVNNLDYEDFIAVFGNVIEHCSLCAASVYKFKPFPEVQHLFDEICTFVDALPLSGHEGILRSHPDLAGRLATSGLLTKESTGEQTSAGLLQLSDEERELLTKWNSEYRRKFNFPFVVCARKNKKEAILQGLRQRLQNTPLEEVARGVDEVKQICLLRLLDIVQTEDLEAKL